MQAAIDRDVVVKWCGRDGGQNDALDWKFHGRDAISQPLNCLGEATSLRALKQSIIFFGSTHKKLQKRFQQNQNLWLS
jgi:hypothetical protein